jgi:hypothetical protein
MTFPDQRFADAGHCADAYFAQVAEVVTAVDRKTGLPEASAALRADVLHAQRVFGVPERQ